MEKQELEAVVRMMKAWGEAANLGNYEALTSLSSLLANSIARLEFPVDPLASVIEKLLLPPRNFITVDFTSRMSHKILFPFGEDSPLHSPIICTLYYYNEPISEPREVAFDGARFIPKSIHLASDQPPKEETDEDTQVAHLIQTAIETVEKIRWAMKRDEEEISLIQANTQQLLEKLMVA